MKAKDLLNLMEEDWAKEAQEKANNAIEYGKLKGYDAITKAGVEVLKMIKDGKSQEEVHSSNAYSKVKKVWGL